MQVFEYDEYNFVNIKNRDVVDVDAFIGDSAIYFALRGARRVIALEPYPCLYRKALVNIRINKVENRVYSR